MKLSQQELLKKYKGNDSIIGLNEALRRAAASGSSNDMLRLIELGASVKSEDHDGRTALYWTVSNNDVHNFNLLRKNGASLYDCDKEGKTILDHAETSSCPEIKEFAFNNTHVLHNYDILVKVLAYLNWNELQALRFVSYPLAYLIGDHMKQIMSHLKPEYQQKLNFLDKILRNIMIEHLRADPKNPKIEHFFSLLISSNKKNDLGRLLGETIYLSDAKLNEYAFYLLLFENFKLNDLEYKILSPYGVEMIHSKIISVDDVHLFYNRGLPQGPHDNFNQLTCENGIKALRDGLLAIKDAPYIQNLGDFLSDKSLNLLSQKLVDSRLIVSICRSYYAFYMHKFTNPIITRLLEKGFINLSALDPDNEIDVANAISLYKNLRLFKNKYIRKILKENLLSWQELLHFSPLEAKKYEYLYILLKENLIPTPAETLKAIPDLANLLTENGIVAIKEGLIAHEQLLQFKSLKPLLSDLGLSFLKTNKFEINDLVKISQHLQETIQQNLKYLFTAEGIKACTDDLITIEDAQKYPLAILKIPNAYSALKEGLITLEQASKFYRYGETIQAPSLDALLRKDGFTALREGLITPEQASKYYHNGSCYENQDNLHILLNNIGLIALRKKLISPDDAANIIDLNKLLDEDNPNIIKALELKLFKLEDFKYGGKYSTWNNGITNNMVDITTQAINLYERRWSRKNEENNQIDRVTRFKGYRRPNASRSGLFKNPPNDLELNDFVFVENNHVKPLKKN